MQAPPLASSLSETEWRILQPAVEVQKDIQQPTTQDNNCLAQNSVATPFVETISIPVPQITPQEVQIQCSEHSDEPAVHEPVVKVTSVEVDIDALLESSRGIIQETTRNAAEILAIQVCFILPSL